MAVVGNPYAKYQNSKVLTASPAELTLMLYEGIIKFINIAIVAIEEKDIAKANTNIMKAERIVDHCIMQALIQGNIHKDVNELNRALEYTRMIRDTWKEVMKIAEKGNAK